MTLFGEKTAKKRTKKSGHSSLRVPSNFGIYHIQQHLGHGGMGDVYKASHTGLNRTVALKVLPITLSTPEFLDRFDSEAYAISRLQHQNIVTIYDYGENDNRKFIAMQFIEGLTLADLIQKEKRMSYEKIINYSKQICRGLKYAHHRDIIHRDIKSGNIMIDKNHDKAFISDFGIATIPGSTRITTTGMAMGTPEYMAPEQCEGRPLDQQCDIYSFGIVLFEMVTGKPPFLAESPLAVAYKQVHDSPPLLSKLRSDIPPRLELIIAKCLKKPQNERYKSTDELLEDMDSVEFSTKGSHSSKCLIIDSDNQECQRITDRRNTDRRYTTTAKNAINKYRYLILALFLACGAALAVHYMSKWSTVTSLSWVGHSNLYFRSSDPNFSTGSLDDDDLTTHWRPFVSRSGTIHNLRALQISFTRPYLVTGIALQTLKSETPGIKNPLYPVTVHIYNGDILISSFSINKLHAIHYQNIQPVVLSFLKVVFEPEITADQAVNDQIYNFALSELKLLGLPYIN